MPRAPVLAFKWIGACQLGAKRILRGLLDEVEDLLAMFGGTASIRAIRWIRVTGSFFTFQGAYISARLTRR